MTENEAREIFFQILYEGEFPIGSPEALRIAIKTINEIQQYREIGTVEDWQKLIKKEATERRKLEEYFMFGSIEEFKALKKEVELYRNLDKTNFSDGYNKAIDEFAERLNKEIGEFVLEHKDNLDFASGISVAWNMVDEVAEQMKGGAENETNRR